MRQDTTLRPDLNVSAAPYVSFTKLKRPRKLRSVESEEYAISESSGEASMELQGVSLTALGAAFIRAYHAMYDAVTIFDDSLAYSLLTEEERATIARHWTTRLRAVDPPGAALCPDEASAVARALQLWSAAPTVLSRARYTEDMLCKALARGTRQYVILGAGMDTFAFRQRKILEKLQVFEVDHPATQTFKLQRIRELGWNIPSRLHFVPLDLANEDLETILAHRPYDPCALTFFSWLGVTYYLSRNALFSSLRAIAGISPPGSAVVFDYFDSVNLNCTGKAAERLRGILDSLEKLGEPLKAGFDPSTLASDLESVGLRLEENLTPSDIQRRYFTGRSDGYCASEHIRFALAVVQ
jgi:methyltransferase (TIGR00027 family)